MYRRMVLVLSTALLIALAGNAFGQTVPAGGWTEDATVGANTTPGGSVSPEAGTYEVTGNGWDIDQQADGFQYLYKELVGDGSMSACVVDNGTGSSLWAKGGVMVRQSTDDNSQHAFTCITGGEGGGAAFQQRTSVGGTQGSFSSLTGGPYAPPYWVRIDRVGNDFSSFISEDGEDWTQAGDTMTIAMQDPVLIGLAVTSHTEGELRTYIFDNLSFTGGVSGESDPGAASVPSPDDEALDVLMRYNWPGNVRELENSLEYAFARTKAGEMLIASKLPPKIRQSAASGTGGLQKRLPGQEEIEILQLLNKHQWNKSKVAKELGIGRTTLWRKMKLMGLEGE